MNKDIEKPSLGTEWKYRSSFTGVNNDVETPAFGLIRMQKHLHWGK